MILGGDMAEGTLTVDMLPARHGDGLWVEWGDPGSRRRMIIDGGTKTAVKHLRDRFEDLDPDDRAVELLVVTHIDLDHIEAPIELLRAPVEGVTFADVWFNDYRHLAPPAADTGTTRWRYPRRVSVCLARHQGIALEQGVLGFCRCRA